MSRYVDTLCCRQVEAFGLMLNIQQEVIGTTGVVVWDAALVLAGMLEYGFPSGWWSGKKVLELGAGTGVVGLVAALGGATVTLSDQETLLPLLYRNREINLDAITSKHGSIDVKRLVWGETVDGENCLNAAGVAQFDVVIASDTFYFLEGVQPLISTLRQVCGPDTLLLQSYEIRTSTEKVEVEHQYFSCLNASFSYSFVDTSRMHPQYQSKDIKIIEGCCDKNLV